MEFKLLKLIYEYSKNGRLPDKQFFQEVFDIVVAELNLANYATKIAYDSDLDGRNDVISVAAYNPFLKEVFIDLDMVDYVLNLESRYERLFDSVETFMFKNSLIAQSVVHELSHAGQFKMAGDKHNMSIENKFVRACFFFQLAKMDNDFGLKYMTDYNVSAESFRYYFLNNVSLYYQYYDMNPTERMAEIKSICAIISALEPIKTSFPNLYEYMIACLYGKYLRGYNDSLSRGICPSQVYLYENGHPFVWQTLDFFDPDVAKLKENVFSKYDLRRRLELGLPITFEEYRKTDDYMRSLNKFQV